MPSLTRQQVTVCTLTPQKQCCCALFHLLRFAACQMFLLLHAHSLFQSWWFQFDNFPEDFYHASLLVISPGYHFSNTYDVTVQLMRNFV